MLQDLPELVLNLVCDYLSYEDVLVLRSTCKGLKRFIDGKHFTKLNLFVRNFSYPSWLFYGGDSIGYPHSYHSDDTAILVSDRFKERFYNVQRMVICSKTGYSDLRRHDETEYDLNCLNFFGALRHLVIDRLPRTRGKLNLPELRIAEFQNYENFKPEFYELKDSSLELNCPRLRALKVKFCRPVLTGETNQLDYLHCGDYGDPTNYLKSIFPNLGKLSTICFETIGRTMQFFSDLKSDRLSLPALSQIKLQLYNDYLKRLDELANGLQELKRDPHLKRINFIFNGKHFDSPNELRRIAGLIRAHNSEACDQVGFCLRFLRDRCLRFLNGTPELHFLCSGVRIVILHEDVELSEEMIKKLKSIEDLEFGSGYRCKPNYSTFELIARTCKSLRSWSFYHQTLTELLLQMLSNHLDNLEMIKIIKCKYETLKPLAKFRNLEYISLDFDPSRDEMTFIYKNSRTLECVSVFGQDLIQLLRTTTMPKVHRITYNRPTSNRYQILEFASLDDIITHYYKNRLFKVL